MKGNAHTYDTQVSELEDVLVPDWIDDDITLGDVQAIQYGGCASGAYMPAVTYHEALKVMSDHGDDVLAYIDDSLGELPIIPDIAQTWSSIACFFLSYAVEMWASGLEEYTEDLEG